MKIFYLLDYGGGYMHIHTSKLSNCTFRFISLYGKLYLHKVYFKKGTEDPESRPGPIELPQQEPSCLSNTFIDMVAFGKVFNEHI